MTPDPAMKRRLWQTLQLLFVVLVLWYAARLLARQWTDVRTIGAALTPAWGRVAVSGALVLASYAVLIATWRAVVAGWGDRLPVGDAARIWFVSNLGRYLPGKVWQIGAMGSMAQRAGVSAAAAIGSSLVIAMVNIVVGFAVVALTGRDLLAAYMPPGAVFPIVLVAMAASVVALPWILPPLLRAASRATGRTFEAPRLPTRAIWIAAAGCGCAWALYGVAFRELAAGLLGAPSGGVPPYVAVFTLSYLIGFLALFAPGGIGVREVTLAALLTKAGLADAASAAILVIVSRLWLTVLEVAPGLLLLVIPARRRTNTSSAPPE